MEGNKMKYCNFCGRIVDERCKFGDGSFCKFVNKAKEIIPKEDIMPDVIEKSNLEKTWKKLGKEGD